MPKKNPDSHISAASQPASFEAAMAELSQLVQQMESGNLPLEASVTAYQRGSELIQFCASQLEKVEQQVKVLEAGVLKPFNVDHDEELA
ncbi:exodeoxyribonuclease VII small subunit [Undibacterium curvum]|jgi:exodeoxyribonuclease VII small subunit|uniref:Exodeoxyribonuclease 7 small subunit n=1 Tax=Undibacterium curvum TaxID=2762294 RepID=A0ABR7A862_9BURK|nr:exodeoxyribonuclease VII small subunit [Undibacterium curvum]MBC3933051.1 exodeoxyribonuclease VII small subunit [Undibacterium curvum]